jgi:peptidyl-tRNA hydrolase, PTH1 family
VKVILGLGNPGPRYDSTRHNVGWWAVDRLARDWGVGPFLQEGPALVARGHRGGAPVLLLKPLTYMNRSGAALSLLRNREDFEPERDLLVVVDDVSLPPGKVRFRPGGSAGGHNGLKSIEAVLGSTAYPRLRIGVGRQPPGVSLVDWVLSSMAPEEEEAVLDRLPDLPEAVECWITDGIEAAMSRHNG